MLLTVRDFIERTKSDLSGLTSQLQQKTARYGEEESLAWKRSLPTLAEALGSGQLEKFHLVVRSKNQPAVDLEYRLPASNSWADVVLLGRSRASTPSAIVVELKH